MTCTMVATLVASTMFNSGGVFVFVFAFVGLGAGRAGPGGGWRGR